MKKTTIILIGTIVATILCIIGSLVFMAIAYSHPHETLYSSLSEIKKEMDISNIKGIVLLNPRNYNSLSGSVHILPPSGNPEAGKLQIPQDWEDYFTREIRNDTLIFRLKEEHSSKRINKFNLSVSMHNSLNFLKFDLPELEFYMNDMELSEFHFNCAGNLNMKNCKIDSIYFSSAHYHYSIDLQNCDIDLLHIDLDKLGKSNIHNSNIEEKVLTGSKKHNLPHIYFSASEAKKLRWLPKNANCKLELRLDHGAQVTYP